MLMSNIYTQTFTVIKSMFSPEIVMKAAYSFVDTLYIHFDEEEDNWLVRLGPKSEALDEKTIRGEFENELLFQAVRLNVYNRTHVVRELLLARAMASTIVDKKGTYEEDEETYSEAELEQMLSNWFDHNDG